MFKDRMKFLIAVEGSGNLDQQTGAAAADAVLPTLGELKIPPRP